MKFALALRGAPRINAIDQATGCLAGALAGSGHQVETFVWDDWRYPSDADAVVVPYNPFMFGHWGVAPRLLSRLARMRCERRGPRLVVMTHEAYVPITDWQTALMGGWQRLQMHVVSTLAHDRFASTDRMARNLSRRRPTAHLPVGSNLPHPLRVREELRAALGIAPSTLVVASFSTGHPSHLVGYVGAAVRAVSEHVDTVFLQLGAGSADVPGVPAVVRHIRPGEQSAQDLADLLASADLVLLPFVDGISTKRGTLMAALASGCAVVATSSASTDAILRQAGLGTIDVALGPGAFAARASELAVDDVQRARLAASGAQLYRTHFDWPVIAARLTAALLAPAPSMARRVRRFHP